MRKNHDGQIKHISHSDAGSIFLHLFGGIVLFLTAGITGVAVSFICYAAGITAYSEEPLLGGGSRRYTMKDDYYDGEDFYEFRQDENNINMLADFYNECYDSKILTMVSVFNQPLFIINFAGDKRFYYNSEEFPESHHNTEAGIKSLQISKKTFEFYGIGLEDGAEIDWENIIYEENGKVPVVLGADYRGTYKNGDVISGNLYGRQFDFTVTGFLKENSCIYYKNVPEFCLDQYIIIPYPVTLQNVDPENFGFEGILYFAMINCDLITDADHEAFIEEIKRISDKTGFAAFSITGIDEFLIKNFSLIVAVWENIKIVLPGAVCLYILWLLILYKIICVIIKHREKRNPVPGMDGGLETKKIICIKIIEGSAAAMMGAVFVPYRYLGNLFRRPIVIMAFTIAASGYILYRALLQYLRKARMEE